MRTESNVMPEEIAVEICSRGIAEVVLRENIEEQERDGETTYTYDEYRLPVPYRDNLLDAVEQNAAEWLEKAKNAEFERLAAEIRQKRDAELTKCDWTQATDSPLSNEAKTAWAAYRQALRDLPEQEGFPYLVVFPALPTEE